MEVCKFKQFEKDFKWDHYYFSVYNYSKKIMQSQALCGVMYLLGITAV